MPICWSSQPNRRRQRAHGRRDRPMLHDEETTSAMRRFWRALALSFGCSLLALICGTAAAELPACKTDLSTELDKLEVPGLAAAIVKDGRIVCASASGFANIAE